jgi:hypothetical protein
MTYESLTNKQWQRYQWLCGYLCNGHVPHGMYERRDALLKAWGDDPEVVFRSRFDALMSVDIARHYVMVV